MSRKQKTTDYDIFVNLSTTKTKIAEQLFDNTEQVLGKIKLLGVKREQNPSKLKLAKRKVSVLSYFYACDFVTS